MLRNNCFCNEFPINYPTASAPAAFIPMAANSPMTAYNPMAANSPMPQEMAPYQMMPVMPAKIELAEAYVPYQYYMQSYPPEEALHKGTMFPELYRPYVKTKRDIGE